MDSTAMEPAYGLGCDSSRNLMEASRHTISTDRMVSWNSSGVLSQKTFILRRISTNWR